MKKKLFETARNVIALLTITFLSAIHGSTVAQEQVELLKTFRKEFVKITPGEAKYPKSFMYGISKKSQVKVTLANKFEIAKYEVPQNLWMSVMGSNPSRWKGDRNSVELFDFQDAVKFCDRVTELLQEKKLISKNQIVRLPTEQEWEYCARAGTETDYSFGEGSLDEHAWHTGNAAGNDPPVGALKPNPWGLYDVHGYLWEWCLNSENVTAADANKTWTAKKFKEKQALRGGSWKDKAEKLKSGYRTLVDVSTKDDAVGIRCVLVDLKSKTSDKQSAKLKLPNGFVPTSQDQIVDPNASAKLLWNDGEFTEGPAAAADGSIYFSDIGNRLLRFDPKSKKVNEVLNPSGRSNGLVFDSKERLIICEGANTGGGRKISILEGGKKTTLSDNYQGKKFNSPNDLALDEVGNVYFSDPRYVGDEPRELDFEGVFFVATDGKTTIATQQVSKPNGILVSKDGKALFVADHHPTGSRTLLKFPIQSPGVLGKGTVMFDFGKYRGIDGMTLDSQGNIYATAGSKNDAGVYVFSPTGKQLAFLAIPGSPTNCTFGNGALQNKLFVTAAGPKGSGKYGLYSIELKTSGTK